MTKPPVLDDVTTHLTALTNSVRAEAQLRYKLELLDWLTAELQAKRIPVSKGIKTVIEHITKDGRK